jgi:hypothetical protein
LYFGDMALTTDKPRAASIIAVTEEDKFQGKLME